MVGEWGYRGVMWDLPRHLGAGFIVRLPIHRGGVSARLHTAAGAMWDQLPLGFSAARRPIRQVEVLVRLHTGAEVPLVDIMEAEDLLEDLAVEEASPEDLGAADVREDAAELQDG